MKKRLRAVILGPQGCGKGTQGELLAEKFSVPVVSSGDLFRAEMVKGSSLGLIAQQYVATGCLAPDELVNGIMSNQLKSLDLSRGFLLDGYPRTVDQAAFLQRILPVNVAVFIKIPDELAVKRLLSRIQCPECKVIYNERDVQPALIGICSVCGGKLKRREDDVEEAIRVRLANYHFMTEPLERYYREKGALLMLKGDQSIDYVHETLMKKLARLGFTP
jgi:adenylate kinase